MPWNILSSAIGAGASIINTKQVNETNMRMQRETNKNNRDLVRMQNEAAAAESEKAYNRSKASNQVNLMRQAGMSRAGAINALNGGGSYTPAPVNTSQDTAPQMQTTDFSGLANLAQVITANKQMKQSRELEKERLEENARQFDKQQQLEKDKLDFEKSKWNEESPMRDEQLTALQFQNKLNHELANYKDENGNVRNLHVEGAAAERIANIAEARLNTLKNDIINAALELPAEGLKALLIGANKWSAKAIQEIKEIQDGKKTAEEIEKVTNTYLTMPDEVEQDGRKFKRIYKGDGHYEWREIK